MSPTFKNQEISDKKRLSTCVLIKVINRKESSACRQHLAGVKEWRPLWAGCALSSCHWSLLPLVYAWSSALSSLLLPLAFEWHLLTYLSPFSLTLYPHIQFLCNRQLVFPDPSSEFVMEQRWTLLLGRSRRLLIKTQDSHQMTCDSRRQFQARCFHSPFHLQPHLFPGYVCLCPQIKTHSCGQARNGTPLFSATQEAVVGGLEVQGQPRKLSETLSQKF